MIIIDEIYINFYIDFNNLIKNKGIYFLKIFVKNI